LDSIIKSPLYAHFSETLAGANSVRAYALQGRFLQMNADKVDNVMRVYVWQNLSNRWLSVRLELCGSIIVFSAALFTVVAATYMMGGDAEASHAYAALLGLALSLALSTTNTLGWSVRMATDLETQMNAVERLDHYNQLTPEPSVVKFSEAEIDDVPPAAWPSRGAISFNNVTMRYRPELDLVLKGLTFSVSGGEKVGVVGRTGAGKSSLLSLLFRLVNVESGSIVVDGLDLRSVGLSYLRRSFSIVTQDPILFSGPLRYNLDPWGEQKDTSLTEVLEQASLGHLLRSFAGGLDGAVSENGSNLSAGERQLLCLARAWLRKSKVLVLDEATAAVDMQTDVTIQQTLRRLCEGCTVLTIAHRLNTIIDYDKILVMDDGRVAEYGCTSDTLFRTHTRLESSRCSLPIRL
jgi:ABC-type multidrug transport system fused ATPase/permease subunit